MDRLKEEFRAAVLLHRPSNLDAAYVLAQLQEEVATAPRKTEFKKPNYSFSSKTSSPGAFPLPPPPGRMSKADEKKSARWN